MATQRLIDRDGDQLQQHKNPVQSKFKRREDEYINEIFNYIQSTYKSHYARGDNKEQSLDRIEERGNDWGLHFAFGNTQKYVDRFGHKTGYNRSDIIKSIHYSIISLYYFDNLEDEQERISNQEVFLNQDSEDQGDE